MSARFGQNLRNLRERAGFETQLALAKRLGFTNASTVSLWESGRSKLPAPKTIEKLAAALRCGAAALLLGVVSPYDALRGAQELPGPEILLTPDEVRLIRRWRALAPEIRTCLETVIVPALTPRTRAARGARRPPAGEIAPSSRRRRR